VRQQGQDWKLPENHAECDESARLSSGSEKEVQSRAELCHVTEGVEVWNEVGSWERDGALDGRREADAAAGEHSASLLEWTVFSGTDRGQLRS
jgi:hypothetical protein